MQAEEGDPLCALDNPEVPNQSRYGRANELLAEAAGRIDLAAMARLLSDHAHKDRFAGENPWIPGPRLFDLQSRQPARRGFDPPARLGLGQRGDHRSGRRGVLVRLRLALRRGAGAWRSDAAGAGLGPFSRFPGGRAAEGDYTTLTGELTHLAARHLDRILELDRATGEVLPGRAAA